jgi:hypothetical protein
VTDPVDPDTIAQAANEVASASVDGQSAAAVPIPDKIKAAQFKAAADAASGTNSKGGRKSPWRSVVTGKAVPPGAT